MQHVEGKNTNKIKSISRLPEEQCKQETLFFHRSIVISTTLINRLDSMRPNTGVVDTFLSKSTSI